MSNRNRIRRQGQRLFNDRWIAVLRRHGLVVADSQVEQQFTLCEIYKRRRSMSKASLLAAIVSVGALGGSPTIASAQTFVEFDAPNAGTTGYLGTVPTSINALSSVTGYTLDANSVTRGFVRVASGDIVEFAAPNAGTDATSGTVPWSINSGGVITGDFADALHVYHGFIRATD